jgi:hypothetical protein
MTNHTIEGLAKKEEEIKILQETVTNLKTQLSNGQILPVDTSALEKQFKTRVAPPPPPPVKPKKLTSNAPNLTVTQGSSPSPPPQGLIPPIEILEGHQSQEVSWAPLFPLLCPVYFRLPPSLHGSTIVVNPRHKSSRFCQVYHRAFPPNHNLLSLLHRRLLDPRILP